MGKRYFLATYSIRLQYKDEHYVDLDSFGPSMTFYDFMEKFSILIREQVSTTTSANDTSILHLTIPEDKELRLDKTERVISGYFYTGTTDEPIDIRRVEDGRVSKLKYKSEADDVLFKSIFFYLYVPRASEFAYLVLERKARFGVKGIFWKSLRKFLDNEGYHDYKLYLNNLLNGNIFHQMITRGNLKKIDFVLKKIPNSMEEYLGNGESTYDTKGVLRTSVQGYVTLSQDWKDFIKTIFSPDSEFKNNSIVEEFNSAPSVDYDEIEFKLELDGKTKTYHVNQQHRTQPDVDVTQDLETSLGIPTFNSWMHTADNLIKETLIPKPKAYATEVKYK